METKNNKTPTSVETNYQEGDKPGLDCTQFIINLNSRRYKKNYILESESGCLVYLLHDPITITNNYYRYTAQVIVTDPSIWIPIADFKEGAKWLDIIPERQGVWIS